MSLTGSLGEFALDDVMVLLAGTKKTGVLVVEGAERSGKVWFDAGLAVGADVAGNRGLAAAVFDLLRLGKNGRFAFQPNESPSRMGAPEPVEEVLAKARALLAEWEEIAKVVPSLSVEVELAGELPTASVVIDAAEWPLIVALGRCRTAAEVAIAVRQGEFEVARGLKELAERGIAVVKTPGAARPQRKVAPLPEETVAEPHLDPAAISAVLVPPSDEHPPSPVVADLSVPEARPKKTRSVNSSAMLKEITNLP
ncbi:MAG TPA: DUF4388 domain-containing protein [Acidimicrobiales bacterium]|nr:DUF4388 domain-containing protein [Acidimicrobiales bacterium]